MIRRIARSRASYGSAAIASTTSAAVASAVPSSGFAQHTPANCGAGASCVVCRRVAESCGVPMGALAALSCPSSAAMIEQHQRRGMHTTGALRLNGPANLTNKKPFQKPLRSAPRVVNTLHIGDVSLPILEGSSPERVASGLPPAATAFFNPSRPEALRYIRWLAQKDLLRQDVCIVGDPGPTKRWLAMLFAQYAGKEVQLLCLSRDTTEADIKQRKEIRDGTLYYANQAAVTAALEGQLLIIDGLERAERNVLPVINNLLENREMHLDNGMMLIAAQRYDQLCAEHGVTDLTDWGLLRVSEHFRVIGLTVPVPKYSGNPLDPPLRSRFQCLFLDPSGASAGAGGGSPSAGSFSPSAAPTYLTYDVIPKAVRGTQPVETMLKFRAVQNTVDNAGSDRDRLRAFPSVTDFDICRWSSQHETFPRENIGELLQRVYPIELFIRAGPKGEQVQRRSNMKHLLKKYALYSEGCATAVTAVEANVSASAAAPAAYDRKALLSFSDGVDRLVPCGPLPLPAAGAHPLFTSSDEDGAASKRNSSDCGDDHSSFFTDAHRRALTGLVQSHACGRHAALVGSAGCGKTNLIREFASLLGYETETQHLFRDMSTRDLLQRRATDPITGSTTWELSPLMAAVKEGRLAVLDGIDQLSPGALAVLQELLLDGNITLFDGTVFKNEAAFEALKTDTLGLSSDAEMNARGIYKVHPSFRLIATARFPSSDSGAKKAWLTSDIVPLLDWHVMPDLEVEDVFSLLANVTRRFAVTYSSADANGNGDEGSAAYESTNLRASDVSGAELVRRQAAKPYEQTLASLVELQRHLADAARGGDSSKMPTLTLRQLRHIAKHVLVFPDDLFGILESSLLLPLTSPLIAGQVKAAMAKYGIVDHENPSSSSGSGSSSTRSRSNSGSGANVSSLTAASRRAGTPFEVIVGGDKTVCKSFGHEVMHITRTYTAKEKAIIPHVPSFFANRLQLTLQAWVAKNLASGNNILLVGNQGVGKNKIVDQLLMDVGLPRHYLQLHRDTTVSSLTINPTVVEGKVMWEDSPLVKAVQQGHVLVVDEIDKAPVEVVHILKGLIEDREMRLGDGRRVSGWTSAAADGTTDPNVIPIHPDFRVIVLANPPGFPFHGNDFYRECGDLFSCFVVQNPDPSSQQELLQQIAPQVPPILITKLVMVFTELGALFAAGTIQYPFSLRELIAVLRHLQSFPRDGLYQALNNVFSFDLLNENTMNHVRRLLHQYVSPITQAQLRVGMGENRVARETLLGKLLNFATFSVRPASPASEVTSTLLAAGSKAEAAAVTFARADVAPKVTFGNVSANPSSPASGSAVPFTERLSGVDFSHLLAAGESVVAARQIASATGGGSKTAVITSANRVMLLPTPASANAGGQIAGVSGITLGSSAGSGGDGSAGGNVTIIQLPKELDAAASLLLGDSVPLAESVLAAGSGSGAAFTPAAAQEGLIHLLSSTAADAITVSTVAIGASAAVTAGSATFSGVTAVCTRLASEGCVAVASASSSDPNASVRLTLLYYGRVVEVTGAAIASHFSKITRIDAISSQVFFLVGESAAAPSAPAAAFVKISVFRDRCEAYVHKVGVADVPPPAGKKPEDIDSRLRLSAASNLQLLAAEGSFAGVASGEGYVPTPGPLTAENIEHSLFVMTPANGGRIGPKDVLYATAKAEAVSEDGLVLVTLEGAVNRSERSIQIVAANGIVPSGALSASSSSSSSVLVASAAASWSWTKIADYGTVSATGGSAASSGAGGSSVAGAIGANSHSHSAEFGHHQLVAKDPNSSTVVVVSSQKGTIREFSTAGVGAGSSSGASSAVSGLMGKVSSLFGGGGAAGSGDGANSASFAEQGQSLMTTVGSDGIGATVSPSGAVSTFDANAERLNESYSRWNSVLKGGVQDLGAPPTPEELNMWYSKPRKQADASNLKHGEEDPDNTPHSGGNNWAGGTGGTDTAGLGGLAGPYRLDKGHPVTQVDPAEKKKVPQHILDEARKMGKEALEKRLKEINMSVSEDERYRDAFERVQGPVQQLQSMLEGLKSKEKERAWMRHQTDGVWDDAKLVEGVTGEKTVYKRRIEADESLPFGKPEQKKRLLFVMDVSASMYRFNGMDQRLTKSVECAIMIMESFKGHEDKIDYSIIGHNGDSGNLPLVPFGQPPTNKKQRMDVCMKMIAYSQFCWSGDNTVTAMEKSLDIVTAEPADGYFVFVISDANFQQYGISPAHLSRIIKAKDEVNMFCIFIASIGHQAKAIQQQLPAGHGFECYDTTRMPIVLQQIFQATDVLN